MHLSWTLETNVEQILKDFYHQLVIKSQLWYPGGFLFTCVNWEYRRKMKIIFKFLILIEKNSSYFPSPNFSIISPPPYLPYFLLIFSPSKFQNKKQGKKQQKIKIKTNKQKTIKIKKYVQTKQKKYIILPWSLFCVDQITMGTRPASYTQWLSIERIDFSLADVYQLWTASWLGVEACLCISLSVLGPCLAFARTGLAHAEAVPVSSNVH